ncbi:MAG: FkbM family methyltransferase [Nibricoccus sp.]
MSLISQSMHWLARKCGVEYRRYCKENWGNLRQAHIFANKDIDLVVDVGANRGDYVAAFRANGYIGPAISFEPLPDAFQALSQRASADRFWHCVNAAVGDKNGEIEMYVSGRETSSSILKVGDAHLKAAPESRSVGRTSVQIRRLDDALAGIALADKAKRIWLKADVQGFEKEVMKGAAGTIKRTEVIELELATTRVYEGGPLILEMMQYVHEFGFSMISFEPMFIDPVTGYVLQGDGIFVRT